MDDLFPFIPGNCKSVFKSSVNYKQFKLSPENTLSDYTRFYLNKFPEILDWYYPNKRNNIILFADRRLNDYRSLNCMLDSSGQYYFSVSVFFINLIPKVLEKKERKDIHGFVLQSLWLAQDECRFGWLRQPHYVVGRI